MSIKKVLLVSTLLLSIPVSLGCFGIISVGMAIMLSIIMPSFGSLLVVLFSDCINTNTNTIIHNNTNTNTTLYIDKTLQVNVENNELVSIGKCDEEDKTIIIISPIS